MSALPKQKRARADLKVALACPGVGLVQRGFERMFMDQFHLLEDDLDVTLYKGGGGSSERQKTLVFAARNGAFNKLMPIHKLFGRTPMHSECLTFALALLPHIRRRQFNIVHCIDPPLTRVLFKLRAMLGMNFKLLYTEGCAMSPEDYPPADHIQQVSKSSYDAARDHGIPETAMTLLPCGLYPQRFESRCSRMKLRQEHGIPEGVFVILSVAAINRNHKRVDYLIEEVSRLEGNYLLWLDGSLDHGDPALAEYAKSKLGDRCRISHVPSEKVGELYRMADIQVLCSLYEAFGLAIVEGAATGLPVLTHHSPHFQWLLPNPPSWIDMRQPGSLAERLASVMTRPDALKELACPDKIRARFDWQNLKRGYIEMYHHAANVTVAV